MFRRVPTRRAVLSVPAGFSPTGRTAGTGLFLRNAPMTVSGAIQLDDPEIAVQLRRNARARRFTLRLASDGDGAVLTLPPGVPEAEARRFLARQAGWLREAVSRQPAPVIVGAGTALPVDGVTRRIVVRRALTTAIVEDGSLLIVEGRGRPGARLAAWLRERARSTMAPMVEQYAQTLRRPLRGVVLKDTRTRWGSCSGAGRVNLSWRLAMAPPEVQAYVAAHEAAHLAEMNHGPRYWATLERLMPDYAEPRRWLRQNGRALHAFRFDG